MQKRAGTRRGKNRRTYFVVAMVALGAVVAWAAAELGQNKARSAARAYIARLQMDRRFERQSTVETVLNEKGLVFNKGFVSTDWVEHYVELPFEYWAIWDGKRLVLWLQFRDGELVDSREHWEWKHGWFRIDEL